MNISALARQHGISHAYLSKRLRSGMSVEEAIKPPASLSQRGRMSKAKGHWNNRPFCSSKKSHPSPTTNAIASAAGVARPLQAVVGRREDESHE